MKTAKQMKAATNKIIKIKEAQAEEEFAPKEEAILAEIEVAANKALENEQYRCFYEIEDAKYVSPLTKALKKLGYQVTGNNTELFIWWS